MQKIGQALCEVVVGGYVYDMPCENIVINQLVEGRQIGAHDISTAIYIERRGSEVLLVLPVIICLIKRRS
jgi:hypothetical protein